MATTLATLATVATLEMYHFNLKENIWHFFMFFKAIGLNLYANLEEKACNKMHLIAVGHMKSIKC